MSQDPISSATVHYSNLSTGHSGLTSSANGRFTFSSLSPGMYSLSVSASGYQDRVIEQLELPVAGHFDVRFDLWKLSDPWHSGAYRSVVMPRSNAVATYYGPDIDTSRSDSFEPVDVNTTRLEASISTVIDSHDINELPLTGRDVYAHLVLLPGVTADTTTARGIGFSVNGQRPSSSNYLLDGLENNDLLVTGPLGVIAPESVQEYRIATSNFSAEYGRTSGFIANAISHTGTNGWHGLVYLHLKNELLDANGFQENTKGIPRAPLKELQPGYSVAGPILHNRLFGSASLELLRFRSRNDPQVYALPTAQLITSTNPVSIAGQLLRRYPAAAVPPGPGDAGLVTIAAPAELDQALGLARIDYLSPSGSSQFFARASVNREREPDLLYNPYPQFSSPFHQGAVSLGFGWTWQVRPSITHEARLGRTGNSARYDRPHSEVGQLVTAQGMADGQTQHPIRLPGSASSFGYRERTQNWEIVDNWTWVSGRHIWKFGGGFFQRTTESAFTADRDGEYLFQSLSDFESDSPYLLVAAYDRAGSGYSPVPYNRQYRYRQADWFAQDAFRVTPRFTLNCGLRYDWFGAPVNTGPAKDILLGLGPGSSFPERLATASYGGLPAGNQPIFDSDNRDWGVRTGLAYDLTGSGRSLVRASYGIFYDRPFDNLWQILSINRQVAGAWSLNSSVSFLSPPLSVAQQQGTFIPSSVYHYPLLFQPHLKNPMVQSAFAGLEQKLSDSMVLEVTALASRGRRLWTTDIVNRFYSTTGYPPNNISGRYNPNFEEINYRANDGKSDYYALTAVVRFRKSRLNGQISYTWSHAIDNQSDALAGAFEDYNQAGIATKPDATVLAAFTQQFASHVDRGNSDFDQRHNLVLFAIYDLPGALTSSRAGILLRNWQVSGVGAIRSGLPYSVFAIGNSTPQGATGFFQNQRANLVNPALVAHPPPTAIPGGRLLLNAAAFRTPDSNSIGNTGRNAFAGPGLVSVDLSISRRFALSKLRESRKLTLRADFYNALNHANLNNPQSYLPGAHFGEALYGRSEHNSGFPVLVPFNEIPRQVQVFIRFDF